MNNTFKQLMGTMVLCFLFSQVSLADTDYDQAKKLLDAGEILPLEEILTKISKQSSERILEIKLETDDNLPLYEIELIDSHGMVWELKVNAKTGEVIERKLDD